MVEIFLIVFGWWWSGDGSQIIDSQLFATTAPVLLAEAQELQHSERWLKGSPKLLKRPTKTILAGMTRRSF